MDLRPPPEIKNNPEATSWLKDLYEWLKYPRFHLINFVPQTDVDSPGEGDTFYDSDDNTIKTYNGSTWDDHY